MDLVNQKEKSLKKVKENKIKAIIFDIGGVLFFPRENKEDHILSSFTAMYLLLVKEYPKAEGLKESLYDIYKRSSKGDISEEETIRLFSETLDLPESQAEELILKVHRDNVFENERLVKLIKEWKEKGYKLGILSNQFHLSKKVLVPEHYYDLFEKMVISCDDKLKKPDPKAFKMILKKLDIRPESALFIDDKEENINIARDLGMAGFLFDYNRGELLYKELSDII